MKNFQVIAQVLRKTKPQNREKRIRKAKQKAELQFRVNLQVKDGVSVLLNQSFIVKAQSETHALNLEQVQEAIRDAYRASKGHSVMVNILEWK